ncbi:MAG: lipoate--protein ligase family protein [Euryarchaeota archaeon]|nr:lipoate--protein ligase family protein [Euryarchaeota archaeon]
MLFLDLPPMHWDATQLLYHALGRLGVEALALTTTIEPYVCVGFSQGIPVEVDADYCRGNGIGVFRREIGGGTVFIDQDQLLIQLVLRRDREGMPAGQANLFRRFLGPVQEAYRAIGMEAEFRPINDLLVGGRKVSGTGGGQVGECNVVATNILLDFDFGKMAGALRCPSEDFRRAARRMMGENLTTVKRERGPLPPLPALRRTVRERYEALLGPMEPSELPYQVEAEMERIRVELFHRRWVSDRGAKKAWREVKVRGGCYVAQVPYEGREVLLEVRDELIIAASVVGAHRREKWLDRLVGQPYCEEQIMALLPI